MYLQKPKFKFCLFLVDTEKKKINQTICMAESYEIQHDGSIIFYQIAVRNEKNIKVPVLAYPKGKWEACILVDDNNEYPVFSNSSYFSEPQVPVQTSTLKSYAPINNSYNISNNNTNVEEELEKLKSFNTTNTNINSNGSINNNNSNTYQSSIPNSNISNNPSMIPGISQMNNPQEFKKLKTEWLEKLIIDYTKTQDFNIIQFMNSISNDPQFKIFKPTESDIIWTSATLIQNRMVLNRKFSNPIIQKQFDLILPSIMKRLWDGKMTPILTTLQEKEETKDANAIDLAVWMARNNYN
jgi:hypothetical protein